MFCSCWPISSLLSRLMNMPACLIHTVFTVFFLLQLITLSKILYSIVYLHVQLIPHLKEIKNL